MYMHLVLLAALAPQGGIDPIPVSAPYRTLDNVEGSWVHFNHVPIRPLVVDAGNVIYAVNTNDSTVEKFVSPTTTPVAVWGVPWNPVSIALWSGDIGASSGPDEILVVTRGTYGLTRLDRATGQILSTLELPSEPGDLLVDDANDRAFVSCSGADCVVQIDLATNAIARTYTAKDPNYASFRIEHPLFMSFNSSGKVLVAPLFSGNNSTAKRRGGSFRGAGFEVLDLTNTSIASTGLPDEDLFLIDPDSGANGTVEPVIKASGTILFAHGFHSNGTHWQLNTEALNQNKPGQQRLSVADHRGVFATNRISLSSPVAGTLTQPTGFVDLDALGTPIGQPYAIAFHPTNGSVFVAGLLADTIARFDASGTLLSQLPLPPGSIPRGLAFDNGGSAILVYCWGTNEIRVYRWSNQNLLKVFTLRHDPTPDDVKAGRTLFYDGDNSLNRNLSCATCHVEGRTDMLAWTLSDLPRDDKGPLLTQTLAGIEKVRPFHWRGEQAHLIDFNAAFDKLLGGTELTPTVFEDFEAFVFSIQNPANGNQHPDRRVVDIIQAPQIEVPSSAIAGQDAYFDTTIFGQTLSCNDCHQLPSGTNNDMVATEAGDPFPMRTKFKVAPFQELWRRSDMARWDTDILAEGPSAQIRAFLGAGTSHAGLAADLAQFVTLGFNATAQVKSDITSFVHQIDQGIAPAVHRSCFMDAASATATGKFLNKYLLPQAQARNCGVAAITCVTGGWMAGTVVRWSWKGGATPFTSDHPSFADRTVAAFQAAATSATDPERTAFFGMPVGMSERFAIDYDFDEIPNGSDASPHVPSTTTTGNPTITLAPVPVWENVGAGVPGASTRTTRIRFETDRPTTAIVSYTTTVSGFPVVAQKRLEVFSKVHAPVLAELIPSTSASNTVTGGQDFDYDLQIEVIDRATHSSGPQTYLDVFESAEYLFDPHPDAGQGGGFGRAVVVGGLVAGLDTSTSPGNAIVTVTATTHYKQGGPPADIASHFALVGSVLVNGAKITNFTPGVNTFKFESVELRKGAAIQPLDPAVDGDFLTSFVTETNGQTTLVFTVPNYTNQSIRFNVEAVVEVDDVTTYHGWLTNPPSSPTTLSILPVAMPRGFSDWSFPDTLAGLRAITVP